MPFISPTYLNNVDATGMRHTHLSLGYHPDTRDELLVPEINRYAGTYILGVQGSGKSGLIEHMVAHDARAGNAVVVIDPHGDLTAHCLAALPVDRLAQTYLLDMEDEEYPFGVNLFAGTPTTTSMGLEQAVEKILHVFEVLWEEVHTQQHLPRYVRAATITLLANPGTTLVDMYAFLTDASVRARLLQGVRDETVKTFWKTQYEDLSEAERTRRVQSLINRLEALFMGRTLIRNIVGQRQTSIDFRKAIEQRELVFIKLPIKTIKHDAELIGTMLVAQLASAIFSFANVPEAERPGLSLYVDEFQHFATPDFSELFTEGRKFGVKVTVAHQYRDQLPDYLQHSTLTARTKVCFQAARDDAAKLAHYFPSTDTTLLPEDITPNVCKELLNRAVDYPPAVQTFVELYLRPMLGQRHGDSVEIKDLGFHPVLIPWIVAGMFQGMDMHPKTRVPDPTTYLDALLYEVMRRGDANVEIPTGALLGFSDLYRPSFYQYALRARADKLGPNPAYPAHLVVTQGGQRRWTRRPEGAVEHLWHFIFCLRELMVYLADHPIGESKPTTTSAVAQMLTLLPRRAAFVRTGDDVGVIYTHTTPSRATGEALNQRLNNIQAQTRVKYGRPREDVEGSQALAPGPASGEGLQPSGPAPDQGVPAHAIPDDDPDKTLIAKKPPRRWEKVD